MKLVKVPFKIENVANGVIGKVPVNVQKKRNWNLPLKRIQIACYVPIC